MPAKAVCISRAIWTRAETIAADVASELGFRCVDEEILTVAADRRNLSAAEVADAEKRKSVIAQFVEDIRRGGIGEMINYIPGQRTLPTASDDVRVAIRDAIVETVEKGNVVIVAHAASYATAGRKDVLRVLVTGSPLMRATRWMAQGGGKGFREAQEAITASDEARVAYLKRFYDVEHESPDDYDVTVSTDKLTPAAITKIIVDAARSMDADHPDVTPPQTGWDLPPTAHQPKRY